METKHSQGIVPTHGFDPFELGARISLVQADLNQTLERTSS